MNGSPPSILSLGKKPSAFLPIAMSLSAQVVLIVNILAFGIVREADEGTAAHLWQMLMAGQLPIMAYFLIRCFPRGPRHTVSIVALQLGAALAALAPVYFLDL